MIRPLFFTALLAFPFLLSADDRPNIIVIMADDLGYGDLSPYRNDAPRTPSAQRLADEGMLFTDAHSPSAVCTPTRYSLLTGRYGWRSYLQDWVLSERMPLLIEEGVETLPAMMQNAGYKTACVGKWHLGFGRDMNAYQNSDLSIGPNTVGFDYFFGVPFSHNSSPEMEVFMENRRIIGLPEGRTVWDPIGLTAARRSLENTAGDLSSAAEHFIRKNKDRPFFLYYPTTNVHFPITPHAAFKMGKRGDDFEGLYDGFVAEFDWAIGQVLRTLDELKLTENTMIIVTSDNGGLPKFGGNNEPWFGDKTQIYEGGHRVPLLVRWPKVIEAGSTCDEPVVLLDLHATCAEVIGTTLDLGVAEDSVSWMPLLDTGNTREFIRRPLVHHSVQGLFAIRDGEWKLIDGHGSGAGRFEIGLKDPEAIVIRNEDGSYEPFSFLPMMAERKVGEPEGQLFHLGDDPGEQNNLYEKHPEVVERLRTELEKIKAADSSLWR